MTWGFLWVVYAVAMNKFWDGMQCNVDGCTLQILLTDYVNTRHLGTLLLSQAPRCNSQRQEVVLCIGRVSDIDAEAAAECFESTGDACADSREFPFAVIAIEFSDDDASFQ